MHFFVRALLIIPLVFTALFSGLNLLQDFDNPNIKVFLLVTFIFSTSIGYLFIKLVNDDSYLIKSNSKKETIFKTFVTSIYILSGFAFIFFFFYNIYGILFNAFIEIEGMKIRLEHVTISDFIYLFIGLFIIIDAYQLSIQKRKESEI